MPVKHFSSQSMARLRDRFTRLYSTSSQRCLERLSMLIGRYGQHPKFASRTDRWSEHDTVLITYGDMVHAREQKPLAALDNFLSCYLAPGTIGTIHILPFFPYSSDDGFSVIDYRQVDPDLGDWHDIQRLRGRFPLMFDLVLNHVSRHSEWFASYAAGIAPERDYFISPPPDADLSRVVRPRALPLLTPTHTRNGLKHLWTTFSEDQIDLNFANPDVLFEFLDILLMYIWQGCRIIRLDAIAYLWKEPGTSCIHLPQTHELVKLFRDVLDMVAPQAILLTETNVPHAENVSYFGAGDEAHMIYQFSLPPLLMHALQRGTAKYLNAWAAALAPPPPGCTFFNFTASHDGVGLRPLEGLLPQDEIDWLVGSIRQRGGRISTKTNTDGTESPYEANISYFSAMADAARPDPDRQVARFMCSQIIAMALRGIPGIYFHSLFATPNDLKGMEEKGHNRAINRRKYQREELDALLEDSSSPTARVFRLYQDVLQTRAMCPAFHPDSEQKILDFGDAFFAVLRTPVHGGPSVASICNVTPRPRALAPADQIPALQGAGSVRDLISGQELNLQRGKLTLAPFQTLWIELG